MTHWDGDRRIPVVSFPLGTQIEANDIPSSQPPFRRNPVHHLLVECDTKGIGKSPVALEGWHTPPRADASFGKGIKLNRGEARPHHTHQFLQYLSNDMACYGHFFDFALRLQNDHRIRSPTNRLADALGDGIDGARAINCCEQPSGRIIFDERLRTLTVDPYSLMHGLDAIVCALA